MRYRQNLPDPREQGAQLRRERKRRGLSQPALATAAGVGLTTLRRVEAGAGSDASRTKLVVALAAIHPLEETP